MISLARRASVAEEQKSLPALTQMLYLLAESLCMLLLYKPLSHESSEMEYLENILYYISRERSNDIRTRNCSCNS